LVSGPEDQIENKELTQEESDYLNRLEQEVRNLPDMYWPPAEYEWAYSAEKVEKLYSIGEIGKLKYNDWKKKKIGKDRIGSWSCSYCSYKRLCIPRQNANMASHFYDVDNLMLDE
jgi:MoaA/NifB/PqqE/SkfB family radical SAM enzyme